MCGRRQEGVHWSGETGHALRSRCPDRCGVSGVCGGAGGGSSPPAPSIGLPLPPIGLPLPPIGLDTSLDRPVGHVTPAPPPSGRGRHFPQPTIVIFGAPYAFGVDPALQSATPGVIAPSVVDEGPPPPPPTGILRLDVEPAALAQVFVDGEFVGTPADLDGRLELAPGTWRIEIRARGYEAIAFDVRIVEGRTITYRETLNKAGGAGKADALAPIPTSPTSPTLNQPDQPQNHVLSDPGLLSRQRASRLGEAARGLRLEPHDHAHAAVASG
jgi:hypothetical protein